MIAGPGVAGRPEDCGWPLDRRDELTARLAGAAGIRELGPTERFELNYADVTPALSARVRAACPAVLRVGAGAGTLIGLLDLEGSGARVLAPDGRLVVCAAAELAAWLRAPVEAEGRAGLEAAVARAGLEGGRARTVGDALCVAALGAERVAEGARLSRAQPSLLAALAAGGAGRRLATAIAGYLAQLGLLSGLWWLVGARAVRPAGGVVGAGGAAGFVTSFVLVMGALVATRLVSSWMAGRLAVDVGQTLRARLLHGVLGLDTEPLRAEGIGRLLGRVIETEALESLALGGGLVAAAGAFELLTGIVILALGLGAAAHLALLPAWAAVAILIARRAQRALGRWSALRLALTHDLVERMAGQRTLVVQQPPELHHLDEDAALDACARAGRTLDRALAALTVIVPRGWLVAAVAVLAPWLPEAAARPGAFATSLGGVLFVYGALRKLAQAFPALGAAAIAWRQVAPLFRLPRNPQTGSEPPANHPAQADLRGGPAMGSVEQSSTSPDANRVPTDNVPLVRAEELVFRYPGRSEPVLSGCGFEIRRGDRILLEGPSGGGKSTIGALVAGLRVPDGGRLLIDGVDQRALGVERWRTRIGSAPQFHENHVFSASLLFNLLLGRAWPPRREDVAEAEAVLRELDLGPLLARMPSGLEQLVGESGWQLSHGERSRLYIARSLLQPLEARVLDESFAALDPETLERTLACVLRRADTLVVIAHP